MAIVSFEGLQIWQKARALTNRIYCATSQPSFSKDFGLIDQLRRAAVSISSNIAEGHGRGGTREYLHFLSMAKGSSSEVRSQLYVALDQGYMGKAECEQLIDDFKKLAIMINNLMKYLKTTSHKGTKYP
jgi:four helix bundle protein